MWKGCAEGALLLLMVVGALVVGIEVAHGYLAGTLTQAQWHVGEIAGVVVVLLLLCAWLFGRSRW
jgi:hypothetical protein